MIYFIHDEFSDAVKVGYTKNQGGVKRRLVEMQVGNPRPLKVLFTIPGGRKLEKAIHRMLSNYRMSGEWFECSKFVVMVMMKINCQVNDIDHDNDLIA